MLHAVCITWGSPLLICLTLKSCCLFFFFLAFFPPQWKTSQFLSTSLWGRYLNAHFNTKTVFVHNHSYSWKLVFRQLKDGGNCSVRICSGKPALTGAKRHTPSSLHFTCDQQVWLQSGRWALVIHECDGKEVSCMQLLACGEGRPVTPAAGEGWPWLGEEVGLLEQVSKL